MQQKVSHIIEAFESWAEGALRPGTVREYRRHFRSWLSFTSDIIVEELRAHHLLRWGKTWHQIQAVQRLFNWSCETAGLTTVNPFKRIKRPPLGERRRVLTRRQCLMLMRDSCWQFRDFLLGMRETLARPQEVRALRWEHLQWPGGARARALTLTGGGGMFVLDAYKARERRADPNRPRVILVSARLGRLLCRLSCGRPNLTGPVFMNTEGQAWTANALRLQMQRGRERLGLGVDHRGEQIVCYSFRHTMATQASAAGVKDRILAELMGHTSTRTTARYQHLDVEHLAQALRKVKLR